MNLTHYSLHNEVTEGIINAYCRFKLGDPVQLNKYSELIARMLKEHSFRAKSAFVYATNRAPTHQHYKKNSLLLAEKVGELLSIPTIVGEYSFKYTPETFYDNALERKVLQPKVNPEDQEEHRSKTVLMIDDSIVSGQSLEASIKELSTFANDLVFVSVVDLRNTDLPEKSLNTYLDSNIQLLQELILMPGYIFTTQMLRTVNNLSAEDRSALLEIIGAEKTEQLENSLKDYAG